MSQVEILILPWDFYHFGVFIVFKTKDKMRVQDAVNESPLLVLEFSSGSHHTNFARVQGFAAGDKKL